MIPASVGDSDSVITGLAVEFDQNRISLAVVHFEGVCELRFDIPAVNFVDPHGMFVDGHDQCFKTGTADKVEAGPAVCWINIEYLLQTFARNAAIVQMGR